MPFVLTDTNILLRSADPVHAMYQEAVEAVEFLRQRGDVPCLVLQNLVEFRTVCTRPKAVNGLGMNQLRVKAEIARLKREHSETILPARNAATEVQRLERRLSDLVNQAYGLTPEEVAVMWATAPPRMPLAEAS